MLLSFLYVLRMIASEFYLNEKTNISIIPRFSSIVQAIANFQGVRSDKENNEMVVGLESHFVFNYRVQPTAISF